MVSVSACHQCGPGSSPSTGKNFSQLIKAIIDLLSSMQSWFLPDDQGSSQSDRVNVAIRFVVGEYFLHFTSAKLRDDESQLLEDLLADAAQTAVQRTTVDTGASVELHVNLQREMRFQ